MNVYVSNIKVPRTPRNGRQYNGIGGDSFASVTVGGSTVAPVVLTPKDIIEFTATALPTIATYNTLYAPTHGQYPEVRCIIIVDSTTEYELQQKPQFTRVDGLIDTIFFDIGDTATGYIILY